MLSIQQQYFADCILEGMNGTEAAVEAGYSEKTAYSTGSRLLTVPDVIDYLAAKRKKLEVKFDLSRERVMAMYAKLAFYDPRAIYNADGSTKPVQEWPDDAAAALCGFEIKEERASISFEGEPSENEPSKSIVNSAQIKKVKFENRKGALDSACRMLGYDAAKKFEITGPEGGPVQVVNMTADEAKTIAKYLEGSV